MKKLLACLCLVVLTAGVIFAGCFSGTFVVEELPHGICFNQLNMRQYYTFSDQRTCGFPYGLGDRRCTDEIKDGEKEVVKYFEPFCGGEGVSYGVTKMDFHRALYKDCDL